MKRLFPLAAAILLIGSALSASAQSRKVDAYFTTAEMPDLLKWLPAPPATAPTPPATPSSAGVPPSS